MKRDRPGRGGPAAARLENEVRRRIGRGEDHAILDHQLEVDRRVAVVVAVDDGVGAGGGQPQPPGPRGAAESEGLVARTGRIRVDRREVELVAHRRACALEGDGAITGPDDVAQGWKRVDDGAATKDIVPRPADENIAPASSRQRIEAGAPRRKSIPP